MTGYSRITRTTRTTASSPPATAASTAPSLTFVFLRRLRRATPHPTLHQPYVRQRTRTVRRGYDNLLCRRRTVPAAADPGLCPQRPGTTTTTPSDAASQPTG